MGLKILLYLALDIRAYGISAKPITKQDKIQTSLAEVAENRNLKPEKAVELLKKSSLSNSVGYHEYSLDEIFLTLINQTNLVLEAPKSTM